MKIEFYTQFEKQLDRVADGPLKAKVAHIVSQVIQADSLSEIKNLKKRKGFKTAY
jgi:hypothetical protein